VFSNVKRPDNDSVSDLTGIRGRDGVQDELHHNRKVLQLHSSQSGHDSPTDLKQQTATGHNTVTCGCKCGRACVDQTVPLSATRKRG